MTDSADTDEIICCDGCGEVVDYPADVAKTVRSSGGSVRCEECGPPPEKPMIRITEGSA